MIACPSCKRRVFTRRDILSSSLDGTVECRACGRLARLDVLSRWMIACVIAIILPAVLLYGGLFYSGHLFVASMVLIFGAWRVLSWFGYPLLTLEHATGSVGLDRRQSVFIVVVLLFTAVVIDGFMAARFDDAQTAEQPRAPNAVHRAKSAS